LAELGGAGKALWSHYSSYFGCPDRVGHSHAPLVLTTPPVPFHCPRLDIAVTISRIPLSTNHATGKENYPRTPLP
jgi:hypothetical protein